MGPILLVFEAAGSEAWCCRVRLGQKLGFGRTGWLSFPGVTFSPCMLLPQTLE